MNLINIKVKVLERLQDQIMIITFNSHALMLMLIQPT